ncbi:uncharacterized protein RHIMIDRAFT_238513 [Rhizopus microsporus ATCC 52813]|uniref:Peroxisomal membrane protein PEX14 n=1 Tax=Rhizopus microsporus ATCC 52813 TaxID=1340429 RepID=A0A2G4SSW4_RHIZD|nr:uncharacterized protein RHIMIDRAFT_238513 [Rhizopus microsporus ATCC 52813]PHZ11859.1 hypothetical protein RHIMIDRAFT_238513 [Rhizopus microsporus ATCC 52813]
MRNDLIESAVSFLSSPNVQNAEKEKKIQFLKNKGLTDEEIEEAFKRTTTTTTTTPTSTATTVKPKVPSRLPYQIVYYSTEPTITRMSTQQLLRYAILLGMGTLSVTVVLLTVVKKFMSKIFNSIAKYQRNRYKDHTDVLKGIEAKLREHTSSTHESLIKEQSHLNSGLHRLLSLSNVERIKNRSEYKMLRAIWVYAFLFQQTSI